MNFLAYLFYLLVVGTIRVYKWFELQIIKFISPLLQKHLLRALNSAGIYLHCPGEKQEKLLQSKTTTSAHLKVNNNNFFTRVANLGSLGVGEAFMDGTLDVYDENYESLTEYIDKSLRNNLHDYHRHPMNRLLEWLEIYAFNLQTRERAFQVGQVHYDIGNDLYELQLDPWMQYTCGYWKDADTLNQAQINKMELLARKLALKPGMRVLDIGCGWGTLCKYLAEKYQVECVGITIGEEGANYGQKICTGLPVDIRVQDYRDIDEQFDRIVSVGMFEHVGSKNHRTFFEVARKCLKDDGVFLLHTIGRNQESFPRTEAWVNKYIFPNGHLPGPLDICKATKNLFVIEDWHNFGQDYAKTLFCWRENFLTGWPTIEHKYGDKFFRMWIYYLSSARGLFLSRKGQLWQIVLSKDGLKQEYRASR